MSNNSTKRLDELDGDTVQKRKMQYYRRHFWMMIIANQLVGAGFFAVIYSLIKDEQFVAELGSALVFLGLLGTFFAADVYSTIYKGGK